MRDVEKTAEQGHELSLASKHFVLINKHFMTRKSAEGLSCFVIAEIHQGGCQIHFDKWFGRNLEQLLPSCL